MLAGIFIEYTATLSCLTSLGKIKFQFYHWLVT